MPYTKDASEAKLYIICYRNMEIAVVIHRIINI
jgi:hypothetical protein